MHRTLIVARMDLADAEAVGSVFADSDSTELPHLVGVSRRTLFAFHNLYFHLVEAEEDIAPRLYEARSHPLYEDVNTRLGRYISPYDPDWREPKDAMAVPFYSWTPGQGPRIDSPAGAHRGGETR
ncbi:MULTISPECIES: TcmI family type II polyketide cyclase [Streptomyces]|uniref:TcmI family type II polyketide cyclase n=1 Tax=Streptomyces TaxID=1883 RepID=UPI00093ACBFF|nr:MULTISPECIES: TcmI family type II polyketide cyclase [unclassified Streptomyces]OKJ01253.1 polyketide synthase [Streptomyces sp. TSRI0261]QNQ35669.1 TcmI family type II polyketide cyclase [Streptomyces sp. CB00271]